MNVSGVKLTDEQEHWLSEWMGGWSTYGNPVPADAHKFQILRAVYDALPVSDE